MKTSFTKQLLIGNTIIYFIGVLLLYFENFALFPPGAEYFKPHQFITYMFLHGNFMHLLFNMLVLASFGNLVEDYMGKEKFIVFYLLAGIGSAFFHILFIDTLGGIVGASGSIFGILAAAALISPDEEVYLFFIPYGFKMKFIVPILFLIEIYSCIIPTNDGVGHLAHVGGGITAVLLYYLIYKK
jgi:membrane associated rhomboid family serine protease